MSLYSIKISNNGGTSISTINLTGSLSPLDVFVISHPNATVGIVAEADITTGTLNFNGNDAIILMKGNDTIDVIGKVGQDPGIAWLDNSGSEATKDHTLTRKVNIRTVIKILYTLIILIVIKVYILLILTVTIVHTLPIITMGIMYTPAIITRIHPKVMKAQIPHHKVLLYL